MATFADYQLEAARLARESLSVVEQRVLANAKAELKRRLWAFAEPIVLRYGITETALYDEIVTDLSAGHEALEELQEMLAFAYLFEYFGRAYAVVGNTDDAKREDYDRRLKRVARLVGLIETAIREDDITFEAADITRGTSEGVTWVA
ncbi:MAG: hypothetical protein ACR2RL_05160 [Gammaproteobacteria bacterium]